MITANCRSRLTADDFDFIVRSLSVKPADRVALADLLTDADMRDSLLEHEAVASAILDSHERLSISGHLYFYVLCRRALKDTPVRSRESADYIASLLEAFSQWHRVQAPDHDPDNRMEYVTDMMLALQKASPREAFLLRSHIGNYALFVSGLFAENIGKRARRGAPDLRFYEQVGSSNFRAASEHQDARRFDLHGIYREISTGFHEARVALNDLAERIFHMDAPTQPLMG